MADVTVSATATVISNARTEAYVRCVQETGEKTSTVHALGEWVQFNITTEMFLALEPASRLMECLGQAGV